MRDCLDVPMHSQIYHLVQYVAMADLREGSRERIPLLQSYTLCFEFAIIKCIQTENELID